MKPNQYKTTLTFRVDPAIKRIIRKRAREKRLSTSRYVELLIQSEVTRQKAQL
jgi:predicted HicB family RNase H-like nuclease